MKTRDKDALIVLGIMIVGAVLLYVSQIAPRPLAEAIEKQHPNYEAPTEATGTLTK
jgi:hypothetical protein